MLGIFPAVVHLCPCGLSRRTSVHSTTAAEPWSRHHCSWQGTISPTNIRSRCLRWDKLYLKVTKWQFLAVNLFVLHKKITRTYHAKGFSSLVTLLWLSATSLFCLLCDMFNSSSASFTTSVGSVVSFAVRGEPQWVAGYTRLSHCLHLFNLWPPPQFHTFMLTITCV